MPLTSCPQTPTRPNALYHAGNFTQGALLPIQGVDSNALFSVISFFYSGECAVNLSNVAAVYDCAVKLEVQPLQEACMQFLQSAINTGNCLALLNSARQVNCTTMATSILNWAVTG